MKSFSLKSFSEYKIALISLISLSFVTFSGKSYENLLRGIDSNIHAKIAMTVTSGPGISPKLPIPDANSKISEPETYFNDHPFFPFWLNGWVMRILGPTAGSARLLTATASVGCVLLTLTLGTILHSRIFGFTSALFLLFARDMILTGATVSLDPLMMFFILLSFILWLKRKWTWVGLIVGFGLWIKTPVVLLVFPTAFLVALIQGQLQQDFKQIVRTSLISLGLGSFVWVLTGIIGGWPLVQDYWIRQVWGTAVGGRHSASSFGASGTAIEPWALIRMIRSGFLPSTPFLIVGCFKVIWQRLRIPLGKSPPKHEAALISGVAIAIMAVAITPMKFRFDYYFNPVFPFLALLSSYSLIDVVKAVEKNFYAVFSSLVPPVLAFLLCTPTQLGPEAFVALKRFMPFIQSYGNCDHDILLVPGGEPIGSSLDYGLVLNFYTGHQVSVEGCLTASAFIRKNKPDWILISEEHLNQCLTAAEKTKYPTQLRMGNQYLLTSLIPSQANFDLTPLERELKPSIDCHPPSYPKDRYHLGF